MSPLQVKILLHYWACCDDFRDGDFSAPAVRDAIDHFASLRLLTPSYPAKWEGNREALKPYVEAVCAIPLPVQQWVISKENAA